MVRQKAKDSAASCGKAEIKVQQHPVVRQKAKDAAASCGKAEIKGFSSILW